MEKYRSEWLIKFILLLGIVLLAALIGFLQPEFFARLWQVLRSGSLQETAEYIGSFGPWAMVFSVGLTVLVNGIGFPPAILFSAANALLFGLVPGILLSWLAETVGVTLSFLLMRFLFRDMAKRLIEKRSSLQRIDELSGRKGFRVMLLARVIPYFPSAVLNALGAVSAMGLGSYVLASLIGKLPSTAIEALIGHDAVLAGQHPHRLMAVIGLAAVLVAGFWLYNRYRAGKITEEMD